MLYMIYCFATFKPTRFDPVTKQDVPVLMLAQSEKAMDAALKDRGLTDMAREKIHQQLKHLEADQIFRNSGIQAAVASSFVSNDSIDYTDRHIQDVDRSFRSLEVPDENRSAVYSSDIDSSEERDRQYDERLIKTSDSIN